MIRPHPASCRYTPRTAAWMSRFTRRASPRQTSIDRICVLRRNGCGPVWPDSGLVSLWLVNILVLLLIIKSPSQMLSDPNKRFKILFRVYFFLVQKGEGNVSMYTVASVLGGVWFILN